MQNAVMCLIITEGNSHRDGLAAVREIRRMEAEGELPQRSLIYALTGNARSGQVENAREAGMDDVIVRILTLLGVFRISTSCLL
jgi:CheY-like chemotaxis protein